MAIRIEDKLISEIRSTLSGFSVERAYLFGSRARGDNAERSDIDLAIVAPDLSDAQWNSLDDQLHDLWTLLQVDVIRLETASDALRESVLREGELIYERTN